MRVEDRADSDAYDINVQQQRRLEDMRLCGVVRFQVVSQGQPAALRFPLAPAIAFAEDLLPI